MQDIAIKYDGNKLSGIVTALVTPLDGSCWLDEQGLQRLIVRQEEAGVDAIFVLGSVGEGPLVDDEVYVEVARLDAEVFPAVANLLNLAPTGAAAIKGLLELEDVCARHTIAPWPCMTDAQAPEWGRALARVRDAYAAFLETLDPAAQAGGNGTVLVATDHEP